MVGRVTCKLRCSTYFEGLYKGPEQNSYSVALPEQFDQPGGAEQPEETDVDKVLLQGTKEIALNPQKCQLLIAIRG